MEQEIWKDIPWYEWLYQVSNLWNVKSLKFWKERILKFLKDKNWYLFVCLSKYNKTKNLKIHRLVCLSFLDNSENKETVNHINWIKSDNRLHNLEWSTRSENQNHMYKSLWYKSYNLWKFWKDNPKSKKVNQYDLEWNFIKTWHSIIDIQKELWINNSHVCACCKWKSITAWWYKWNYF